ncbi:30S ribosomal protein S5 alanine N-acetyltransferase [Rahnella sp. AA]|uniref:GNAT family N-acetyltransferase n=1 Tax=Rahnella sp. AA TaxID=2057180 RepID=UPI000C3346A1|nr:GNAT family N-acetyltransferase [Rahnella sp. AA]PKE28392.1 30S ribosomal protein S5 alanine N-acetyltransferase [Rahnella sp. AA]
MELAVTGASFYLKILGPEDTAIVHAYFRDNAGHLAPWEPLRPADFYSTETLRKRLTNAFDEAAAGTAFQFGIISRETGDMLGACNFTGIARGAFQACHLGYSVAENEQGKGLMHRALETAISYLFREQGLHRIMASYIPDNVKSERVLHRLGFEREGYARSYLKIAGRWQDHVLTALINPQDNA